MPRILLKSVQCIVPDEIDKDEMYLKYNGEKIWPEGTHYFQLDTGDKVDLGVSLEVPAGWNEIELWDFDYMSQNDFLGKFRFEVDDTPGKYSTSMNLEEKGSSASYILYWDIL